jgi:hypothetical protein
MQGSDLPLAFSGDAIYVTGLLADRCGERFQVREAVPTECKNYTR